MTLRDVISRLERYFQSEDNRPRLINFPNQETLKSFQDHYDTGKFIFKYPENYSSADADLRLENLYDELPRLSGIVFLSGFTSQLKLYEAKELEHFLVTLAGLSLSNCKLVVLCYQCENALTFSDQRLRQLVYYIDGNPAIKKSLCFIRPELVAQDQSRMIHGIDHIGTALEKVSEDLLLVLTQKKADTYRRGLYTIEEISDAFDALCQKAQETSTLKKAYGTDAAWLYAYQEVSKAGNWYKLITEKFGSTTALDLAASSWENFDSQTQWLYMIALKMFGAGKNNCLNSAAQNAEDIPAFVRNIYRGILQTPWDQHQFTYQYQEWKQLRKTMFDTPDDQDVADYVNIARQHGANALWYLTDLTRIEKEAIISCIDQYNTAYDDAELKVILDLVYPDLSAYLNPYCMPEYKWLEEYFTEYRFSKIRNHISKKLRNMANEQAFARDFYKLPPRMSKFSAIAKDHAFLYFIDAMGTEFVPYILEKCKEYGLNAKVSIAHCELPSLTRANKDFWDSFDPSRRAKVGELDEIKHKGKENYDYQITKVPLHLIREMEILKEVIQTARKRLLSDETTNKIIFCADHGATRMAVINEHILDLDVNAKGTNGGRVCEYTDDIRQIPDATREGEYYVLAGYDRFKGGKPASVEAHGGATLEEVVIPIIELTTKEIEIEITVLTPMIEYSFKQPPILKIFSKTALENVNILIQQQWFEAELESDGHHFTFILNGLKRGDYIASVYSNGNEAASGLPFTLKSKVGSIGGKGGILSRFYSAIRVFPCLKNKTGLQSNSSFVILIPSLHPLTVLHILQRWRRASCNCFLDFIGNIVLHQAALYAMLNSHSCNIV